MRVLTESWQRSGIERGDVVLLHSNISRTLRALKRVEPGATPAMLLQSFLDAVGPKGTLLLPLFNFEFTEGKPFDIRSTPSHMGALTEAGRSHPDAVRTGHPIYSFAVIGHYAPLFTGVNNRSGYGEDSPFALLRRLHGKIAVLDLEDQHSMTFYHHVEEMRRVSYRYFKDFTGPYVNADGVTTEQTYSLFVRDLEAGVLTDVNAMGELLWEQGLYRGDRPGVGSGLRVIEADAMFAAVSDVIAGGRARGLLYSVDHSAAA